MLLDTLALEDITENHLRQLVEDEVREGRSVEYKLELPGNSHEARREFLADASSFSNTIGGHLIFGIEEDGGIPTSVPGFASDNIDHEIQRLTNTMLNGLDSRAPGIEIHPVRLDGGNFVIILRITRSWAAPHRVTLQGHDKFYMRNPGGKHPMDVVELRTAFMSTYEVGERIRRLRSERLLAIETDEGPAPLCTNPKVVLHIVPFTCFDPLLQVSVATIQEAFEGVLPLYGGVTRSRATIEGYIAEQQRERLVGCVQTYVECTRTGIVEAVDAQMLDAEFQPSPRVASSELERAVIEAMRRYLGLLDRLSIPPPFFIMLSLLGIDGYRLAVRRGLSDVQFRHSRLILPELALQSVEGEVALLLRPLFDSLWNAWGYIECENYNGDGQRRA